MKKILKQSVMEESKYFCDKHPDRECFSSLKTSSWYGSDHDMMGLEIHLCDECIEKIYKLLEKNFGVKPEEIRL